MTGRGAPPPRALAGLLALAGALAATPARASALDPARAEEQAREITAEEGRPFCDRPPRKLADESKRVCPLAPDVPGCEKLVAACAARDVAKTPEVPSLGKRLGEFLQSLGTVAAWILVVAIVAALLVPVLLAIRARKRDLAREPKEKRSVASSTPLEPEPKLDEAADAEALLRDAEASAAAGAFDRALFGFLRAALVALDRRGAIRVARDRTHGEYVRACREPEAKQGLRAIVAEVDRVRFGGEAATAALAREAGSRAAAIVRAGAAVSALALALLAPGCDGLGARGADPAGPERLLALLKKQGATVGAPSTSLATLPLPSDGASPAAFDPGAVLVIDAERVPLEDEARLRIERWVRAGGTLVIAGAPGTWPAGFEAERAPSSEPRARFDTRQPEPGAEARDDRAHLARADAFRWGLLDRVVASGPDEETYAALGTLGEGRVLAFANDDLFTNLGLSREGNPAALIAALGELDRARFLVARPEHAASPPPDPLAALVRAGLGLALVHAAALVAVLYAAKGARLGKPSPARPPARRAFVEHVRAVGALYDRAELSTHALAAYGRFALERLRGRLPRGEHDLAAFLATRAGRPREVAAAMVRAAQGEPPPGRAAELAMLKELGDATAKAIAAAPAPPRARGPRRA